MRYKPYSFSVLLILSSYYSTNIALDLICLSLLIKFCKLQPGLILAILLTTQTFDLEISGSTYRSIFIFGIVLLFFNSYESATFSFSRVFLGFIGYTPLLISAVIGNYTNSNIVAFQFFLLGVTSFLLSKKLLLPELGIKFNRDFLIGLAFVAYVNSIVTILQVANISDDLLLGHLYEGRPTGLYLEPDFLGYFAVVGIVALYYLKTIKYSVIVYLPLIATLMLSLARAAWLSACVFLLIITITSRNFSRLIVKFTSISLLGLIFTFLIIDFIPTNQLGTIRNRVESIYTQDPTDTARLARTRQWDGLLELAAVSPWHGAGLTASGRVLMQGGVSTEKTINNVGSNWILSLWAEAKYLSIPYFSLIVYAIWYARNTFFNTLLIVTIVNSLFTNMMWYTITPFLIALALQFRNDKIPSFFPRDRRESEN